MKLKRILYSTLALTILSATSVSGLEGNATTVQASSRYKVKLLSFKKYHKKVMVYGKSGAIYTSYKLTHIKANLRHYKHKPFKIAGVAKIKMANGKKINVALVERSGIYGYVKINQLFAYKSSTAKKKTSSNSTHSENNGTPNNSATTSQVSTNQVSSSSSTSPNYGAQSSFTVSQTNNSATTDNSATTADVTQTSQSSSATTSSAVTISNSVSQSSAVSVITSSSSSTTTSSASNTSKTSQSNASSANSSNQAQNSADTSNSQGSSTALNSDSKNGVTNNSVVNNYANSDAIMTALNQINAERQQRGIGPYTLNSKLMAVADQRARQLPTNFSHFDSNGNAVYEGLISQNGMDLNQMAENIGMVGDPSKTVAQCFLSDIHDMMYDDADSNWGHRDNFLNKNNTMIGIGVYQTSDGSVYMAYDMGGTNN